MSDIQYGVTDHARDEATERRIPLEILEQVMISPDEIIDANLGRKVYQSKVDIGGKMYLIRANVEITDPLTVVTVYRTSKIRKYWSQTDESDL